MKTNVVSLAVSVFAAAVAVAGLCPSEAWARSTGLINKAKTGCGGCHGKTPSHDVQVQLLGPAEMEAGEVSQFTVIIEGGPGALGGYNVAVDPPDAVTLIPDEGSKWVTGQLTHVEPKAPMKLGHPPQSVGMITFGFRVKAGTTPGKVTFYAAGNSVDGSGTSAGDSYNFTQKSVTLLRAGASSVDISSVPGGDPSTDEGTISVGAPGGHGAGCSTTGLDLATAFGMVPVLGLMWGRRMRRRSI